MEKKKGFKSCSLIDLKALRSCKYINPQTRGSITRELNKRKRR